MGSTFLIILHWMRAFRVQKKNRRDIFYGIFGMNPLHLTSVADPKLLISYSDPDPIWQVIIDPDPDPTYQVIYRSGSGSDFSCQSGSWLQSNHRTKSNKK